MPDISHFKDGQSMNGRTWDAVRGTLIAKGWTLNDHAGHGKNTCNRCGENHMIDLYFIKGELADRNHEELCYEHCLICGWTVEQIAVYELEMIANV